MRLAICVALLLVLPVSIVGGGATAAAVGGAIVFDSNRDGDWDIYSVNVDGTGLTQLTRNDFEDSSPRPSPDGKLIAFTTGSGTGMALMNADGSDRRDLPSR